MSRGTVAYFSMEVALESEIPNYAGGLGVLAADTLMSAADLGFPMVGITLMYHRNDDPAYAWNAEFYLTKRPETVAVEIEGRSVTVAIWQRDIVGREGHIVPVFFLSTHHPGNERWDRDLTKFLYAPDRYTRLGQEVVLGIGGVRALERLGYGDIAAYHLNEGHAALATLELLRRSGYDEATVKRSVTFTTHTPIAAGHDYFEYDLAGRVMREMLPLNIRELAGQERLGMTQLAIRLSKSTNSVSLRHKKVCEEMFPGTPIGNVTNGVYAPRWAGEHMGALFQKHLPGWEERPEVFSRAGEIPDSGLAAARAAEKQSFIRWVNQHPVFFPLQSPGEDDLLREDVLTIGFARRSVPYKRPDLVFRDIERLARIGGSALQLVFANRCHPDDAFCNEQREKLRDHARQLRGSVRVVLIPDYNLDIAKRLVAGCDVWLNTPVPPMEASGTSGMKAALNGGLNLSIRDGWWIEGLEREPQSGWGFSGESEGSEAERGDADAKALMDALEETTACYRDRPDEWRERMKRAIALLSHFNTARLVGEYDRSIWQLGAPDGPQTGTL